MEIIGSGFLARHLHALGDRHPRAVALAAGVSLVGLNDEEAFAREARLVLDVARRCRRTGRTLVFFSTASAGVYNGPDCSGREDCPHPGSPYGHHKLAMERLVRESGCSWLILRLSHLVGRHQASHQLVPVMVRQVESGTARIFVRTRRDLLDIRHFLGIVDALLAAGVAGDTINVASGTAVPMDAITSHIADILGRRPHREYVEFGSDHQVSVRKLHSLLPGGGSAHRYGDYKALLDRYVPHYASKVAVHGARPH
ncbi:NAD-dependent epimerase/dehydratase family protein [Streptomyces sp. enrichment culture]|uniref:NAD-dependent epimerase/dehydratase family protein n=1 Tax=Streptomyces sp. enrichment culture TaxID=1795815 RepID=UPI003F55957A